MKWNEYKNEPALAILWNSYSRKQKMECFRVWFFNYTQAGEKVSNFIYNQYCKHSNEFWKALWNVTFPF